MKMGAERRTGNHKGCPYDRFAGGYFQRNRSCRLSPTPPIMRVAAGRFANRPYGRLAGGIVSILMPLAAGYENWIPAPYQSTGQALRGNDGWDWCWRSWPSAGFPVTARAYVWTSPSPQPSPTTGEGVCWLAFNWLRVSGVFLAPSRNRLCRHGTGRGTGEARGSVVGHPASAHSAALVGPDSLERNEDFCVPGSRCPRSSRA